MATRAFLGRPILPHIALALALAGCHSLATGSVTGAIDVAGQHRTYVSHVPASVLASQEKKPLVIALHGRLSTGAQTERGTRMTEIAEREGFAVVYPDG